jgi:hypothetical protein
VLAGRYCSGKQSSRHFAPRKCVQACSIIITKQGFGELEEPLTRLTQ